jgi:peptidoglycan/LPS O-acetylase OafA/YrhL
LGSASYVLYLFHGPITSSIVRIIKFHLAPGLYPEVVFALLAISAIGAALAIHLFLETPVLRMSRMKTLPRAVGVANRPQ